MVLFDKADEATAPLGCDFTLLVDDIAARAARGETAVFTLEGDIAGKRAAIEPRWRQIR